MPLLPAFCPPLQSCPCCQLFAYPLLPCPRNLPRLCRLPCQIYQDSLASSNAAAEEGFTLSRLVRAFGTEGGTMKRYDRTLLKLRHISIRQSVAYALYVVSNNFL